jgi:hypothetical protein
MAGPLENRAQSKEENEYGQKENTKNHGQRTKATSSPQNVLMKDHRAKAEVGIRKQEQWPAGWMGKDDER